jgi:GNAT superfamily N-acetyltransferase
VDERLQAHLSAWLGEWPAQPRGLLVVGAAQRTRPGWDGKTYPVLAVTDPAGNGVLSVPPEHADAAEKIVELDPVLIASILGLPEHVFFTGVFRWTRSPCPLPDAGGWEPAAGAGVPDWLHPFGGDVLIARDDHGAYLAGVGLKRHHPTGTELAVGTEPVARGQGLARRLVAKAARRVVDGGAVATYVHDPHNVASARVAAAAGFPDLGWRVHSLMRA